MARRSLNHLSEPFCCHVTQRCQERRFLFRWQRDRRQYLQRLREMTTRYPVSVLNYVVTSNHVHLLLWSEEVSSIASGMQFLSGAAAQDYNRRLEREGAFWSGRYRPTLIEPGFHLSHCFFYIEMNMVRAGVVSSPGEWVGGAYDELSGRRKRYRIIDQPRLLDCLECPTTEQFRTWYSNTVDCEAYNMPVKEREPYWTEASAVGSREWIGKLGEKMPRNSYTIDSVSQAVSESPGTYILRTSKRRRESLLTTLT